MEILHQLNKTERSVEYKDELFYPLYISIVAGKEKAFIKSRISYYIGIYHSDLERYVHGDKDLTDILLRGLFSETIFTEIENSRLFPVFNVLQDEIEVLEKILELKADQDSKGNILESIETDYEKYSREITEVFDTAIKERYKKEIQRLFLDAINDDPNTKIFKTTNYFIHYVNWDNSFQSLYDATYEMMPSALKLIENNLSGELVVLMKAYLAYHTQVNVLKRFFEKREKGKIFTLSYLDWKMNIKDMILKQFTSLFGKSKAITYVETLDNLLEQQVGVVRV